MPKLITVELLDNDVALIASFLEDVRSRYHGVTGNAQIKMDEIIATLKRALAENDKRVLKLWGKK